MSSGCPCNSYWNKQVIFAKATKGIKFRIEGIASYAVSHHCSYFSKPCCTIAVLECHDLICTWGSGVQVVFDFASFVSLCASCACTIQQREKMHLPGLGKDSK